MKTQLVSRILIASLVLLTTTALAQGWSDWEVMSGSGQLSMRSAQSGSTCAFAFRNNSTSQTLRGAKIRYIHSGRVDNDILPALGPQQSLGGWTAFSVEDRCSNVRVQIYDESWD